MNWLLTTAHGWPAILFAFLLGCGVFYTAGLIIEAIEDARQRRIQRFVQSEMDQQRRAS